MDKESELLKRRIRYFNKKYGGKLSTSFTKRGYKKAERQLERKQKQVKFEAHKERLAQIVRDNDYRIKVDAKTERGLKGVEKRIKAAKKRELTRNFQRDADEFIREVQKYNKSLGAGVTGRKLNLYPKNKTQLKEYRKILSAATEKDYKTVKALLKVPKNRTIHDYTVSQELRKTRESGYTYRDRILFHNAVEAAKGSALPELAQLFRDGGENLVKDLMEAGFTFTEFAYINDEAGDASTIIKDGLEGAMEMGMLSDRNSNLIKRFLKLVD